MMFRYKVLHISDGIENLGALKWDLTLCLLLAWILVYVCICKGIKSSGKVSLNHNPGANQKVLSDRIRHAYTVTVTALFANCRSCTWQPRPRSCCSSFCSSERWRCQERWTASSFICFPIGQSSWMRRSILNLVIHVHNHFEPYQTNSFRSTKACHDIEKKKRKQQNFSKSIIIQSDLNAAQHL